MSKFNVRLKPCTVILDKADIKSIMTIQTSIKSCTTSKWLFSMATNNADWLFKLLCKK